MTGTVAIQNDYLMRGYTISGGRPTVALNLYYDTPSGIYLNGSTIGALGHGGKPEFLGYIANIGYAARVAPHLSLDGGISRVQYSHYARRAMSHAHYTDFYIGALGRGLSARLHYSPDYLHNHASTLYAEIDGAIEVAPKWQIDGHVGILDYLERPSCCRYLYDRPYRASYDWRIGVTRQVGAIDLNASISSRASLSERDASVPPRDHVSPAVTIGASWAF